MHLDANHCILNLWLILLSWVRIHEFKDMYECGTMHSTGEFRMSSILQVE